MAGWDEVISAHAAFLSWVLSRWQETPCCWKCPRGNAKLSLRKRKPRGRRSPGIRLFPCGLPQWASAAHCTVPTLPSTTGSGTSSPCCEPQNTSQVSWEESLPPVVKQTCSAPFQEGCCCAHLWQRLKPHQIKDTPSCISGKRNGELAHKLDWQLQRLILPSSHPLFLQ